MNAQRAIPRLLAIGGSDSSGGAGIQADIKTGAAMGVDVCTVITAITAQNSLGVQGIEPTPLQMVRKQLSSVCADIPPHAVKLGMLFDEHRVMAVAEAIHTYQLRNVVCDPVLASTSGTNLLSHDGAKALLSILPMCALLTPNVFEASALSGRHVQSASELLDAGRALLEMGAEAVLLKGGHLSGERSTDVLLLQREAHPISFSTPRIRTRNDHGTGCVLASAIASGLALGLALPDAVARGRSFLQAALQQSIHLWHGEGRGGMNLVGATHGA